MEAEPALGGFPPLDLGLVVQLVLSLFVLLLSYDSVCGQKEIGTLRHISSFSLQSSVVDRQESGCSDSGIDGFRSSASGRVAHELAYQQIRDEAQADGLIVRDRLEAEFEKQT